MRKIRWGLCIRTALLAVFALSYIPLVLPTEVTPTQQARLDRIVRRIEQWEYACTEPKLKGALRHTAYRYRKLGPFGVRIQRLPGDTAGLNIPWVPGLTIDPEAWDYPDDQLLKLLVHEAHHDFYPWLGHYHFWGTIPCADYPYNTELDRLMNNE